MTQSDRPSGGLRAVTREAVRQRLSEVAVDLFAEHGFECVTVEQVAAASGISTRSVHRYFPAKEDMVIGTLASYGELVRDAVAARPADEPALESLHAGFAEMMRSRPQTARDKVAINLLSSTPALRARQVEKHLTWADLLTPVVAERLTGTDITLRSRVLVQISLEAFTIALAAWADPSETREVHEILSLAFDAIRHS